MPIPIANFTSFNNGLLVGFQDKSTNSPTSWTWSFGDGGNSTEQNPSYVYGAAGDYTVQLIATNDDGSSEAFTKDITVIEALSAITQNTITSNETPAGMTLPDAKRDHYTTYWRNMFYFNLEIDEADALDDAQWPYLWKILIARLVIRDYVLEMYQDYLANAPGEGGENGNVKKVETGPSNVEFFDLASNLKNLFTENNNGVSPFDQIFLGVCEVASKLTVHLDCCTPKTWSPIVPQKVDVVLPTSL